MSHRRLLKSHVLFLGDSTPDQTSHGLQSLQQPLMKCYPVDNPGQVEGVDSWVTIFTSGILLQYVGTKSDQPAPIWFPIQNLFLAAATKCVNYLDPNTGQRMETEFMDINSEAAARSSHPPLFSIIVRRTQGKRILRCYTFLVRDEEPAVQMVDAAKHAFTNREGWSDTHPPQELIRRELVSPTDDVDDIDQFDSVSAAGRKSRTPGSDNPEMSDSDSPNRNKSFPSHLVKKYTLTNTARGMATSSPRRPIPAEFRYANDGSMRSALRVAPRPIPVHMMDRGRMSGSLSSSVRTTSSVRVITDPRTRTPIIEKVITEQVPVAVPVYQPPPPPQIIHEVKPVYIPQPPQIREVPVEKQVPVPVPVKVPVPYAVEPLYDGQKYDKRSYPHKPSKRHHTFKSYQIFDEQFARKDYHGSPFFPNPQDVHRYSGSYPNGHLLTSAEPIDPWQGYPRQQGRRRRKSDSDSELSSDDDHPITRRHHAHSHRNGGIEITELHSPDEQHKPTQKESKRRGRKEEDYEINQLDHRAGGLSLEQTRGPEFKWSTVEDSPERKSKKDKKPKKDTASPEPVQMRHKDKGADAVDGSKEMKNKRSSFQVFRQTSGDAVIEELKQKKDKKKREKSGSRVEEFPDYNGASTSKEYYFKEHTENPPRNWMDQRKGYMNEKAFSSSLANDTEGNITNAYDLNRQDEDDTMMERSMPPPPGSIPVAPPLPANWKTGDNAANLY